MSSYVAICCVNCYGKTPSLRFHQITSNKQKEIRQEQLCHIKSGQNSKYLSKDLELYICSKHFEKDCLGQDLQVLSTSKTYV